MSKPVEQALTALVPSLNGPLPPELLNIAVSLLAQSRSKASSLKPDEEIARTYACAHLACERLKQRLNLPPITARPPIPPRAYKKVYSYLDSALTGSSGAPSQPQTPTKRTSTRANASSAPSTPATKRTPTAATTTTTTTPRRGEARTPTASAKKRPNSGTMADDNNVPEWVMPLIRQLARALQAPAAPPHVYAGVCSVLKRENFGTPARATRGRGRGAAAKDEGRRVEEGQVPALVVVVMLYAVIRLAGRRTSGREHHVRRGKAVGVLMGCETCAGRVEEELVDEVEGLLMEGRERGWLEMEWFGNIVEGSGLEVGGAGEEDDEAEEDARLSRAEAKTPLKKRRKVMDAQAAVSQGGLGTMMQDKVDYLSEERRAGYLRWKERVLKRVEEIEREDGVSGQAMDVSG